MELEQHLLELEKELEKSTQEFINAEKQIQLLSVKNQKAFRNKRIFLLLVKFLCIMVLLSILIWYIITNPNDNNPMAYFVRWTNELDEVRKNTMISIIGGILLVPIGFLSKSLYKTYKSTYKENI